MTRATSMLENEEISHLYPELYPKLCVDRYYGAVTITGAEGGVFLPALTARTARKNATSGMPTSFICQRWTETIWKSLLQLRWNQTIGPSISDKISRGDRFSARKNGMRLLTVLFAGSARVRCTSCRLWWPAQESLSQEQPHGVIRTTHGDPE